MSTYQFMDHAEWLERQYASCRKMNIKLSPGTPETFSEFQKRVIDILGMVGGGIYNAPINIHKIDWKGGVSVVWQRELATFDGRALTMLVLLCHSARIRLNIRGCGPSNMRFSFTEKKHAGEWYETHPDLQEAVHWFEDEYLPKDHRVRYRIPALMESGAGAGQ